MLQTLINKEILNNLLNLRFALAYFLCTFLLVGSATIMFADYLAQKKNEDLNRAMYDEQIHNIGSNIFNFLWSGKTVVRGSSLARIFALGADKDPDPRATIEGSTPPYFYGDFKRNPLGNLFPSVDMLFVVGVILSLLIFVLTYDMVAGEREEGTLRLLLSCPVPRDRILAAKWLGGFVSLLIPYVTSALIVMLMLAFNSQVSIGAQGWLRILAVFGVCALYIAVVFSLSMTVSVFFGSSSTAILTLLLTWVLAIVALPAVSTPLAFSLVRPAGSHETETEMQRYGILGLNALDQEFERYVTTTLNNKPPDKLTPDESRRFDSLATSAEVRIIATGLDSVLMAGRKAFRATTRVETAGRWIARLSPLGCLQNACVAIAGTGIDNEAGLRKSVEDYAQACAGYAREFMPRRQTEQFSVEKAPSCRPPSSRASDALAAALPDVLLLVLMGVLFSLTAFVRFLRTEAI